MNIDDNIWMIQNPKDKVSKYYTDLVLPSWDKFGYYINTVSYTHLTLPTMRIV